MFTYFGPVTKASRDLLIAFVSKAFFRDLPVLHTESLNILFFLSLTDLQMYVAFAMDSHNFAERSLEREINLAR